MKEIVSKMMGWENTCGTLLASFACFDPSMRLSIDMESWKDMVPYITDLWMW